MGRGRFISQLVRVSVICVVLIVIDAVWRFLEYIEYGCPQPSISDSIIGVLFAISVYKNLRIEVKSI